MNLVKSILAFLLVFHFRGCGAAECSCPNGWTYFEGSCYHLGYQLSAQWAEAENYCKTHGSKLVKIDGPVEDQFVQSFCKRIFRKVHDESDSVWTAASDSITEGIWEWNWGNAIMEYTNWDEGQPDSRGGNQDCLSLYAMNNFTWHDSGCEYRFHPLCEISLEGMDLVFG